MNGADDRKALSEEASVNVCIDKPLAVDKICAYCIEVVGDNAADRSGRLTVVAASNRPNAIDPALRRAGRLDREISVPVPGPQVAPFLCCVASPECMQPARPCMTMHHMLHTRHIPWF